MKLINLKLKDSFGLFRNVQYIFEKGESPFERYARVKYVADIVPDMDFGELLTECMDKMCIEVLTNN